MGIKGLYYRCEQCDDLFIDVYEVNKIDNLGNEFKYYLCEDCLLKRLEKQKVKK